MQNIVYNGKCLDVIKTFPDKSVNCVITSPPYWQLRDYGWDGQWGLEPTYQMYLENLWILMDEIYRVLADGGTCWINLGDTYSSKSYGTGCVKEGTYITNRALSTERKTSIDTPDKCLLLIPHRFAIGCIDRGWIMRNDIIWAKRNGMPESVTDRFSKKHEYFFFMTKKTEYYFDLDGVRDKHKQISIERAMRGVSENNKWVNGPDGQTPHNLSQPRKKVTKIDTNNAEMFGSPRARYQRDGYTNDFDNLNPLGKNPGSVSDFWDIPTKPSSKAHYATFNSSLIDKPIIAGCPVGGVVLDPFAGTGTTLVRAYQLGRKVIGIEGSAEYCKIANELLSNELNQLSLFA